MLTKLEARPLVKPDEAEAAFMARMDTLIAPILKSKIDTSDAQHLADAEKAVAKLDFIGAKTHQSQIKDPAAAKIVQWMILRSDALPAAAEEIEAFRRSNPDFPQATLLRQRAEESLLARTSDPKTILAFFSGETPSSGAGLAALAAAHLGNGDRDKARAYAARAWREHDFPQRIEQLVLNTFGALLTEADHKYRTDRLLMTHIRWKSQRVAQVGKVRRMLPLLSKPEQKKIEARIAAYLGKKDAGKQIAALPADAMKDWGVYFAAIQVARRSGRDADDDDDTQEQGDDAVQMKEAWRLLLAAPTDPARIVSPDDWWIERRSNAYGALKAGQPRIAYDLVRDPGPVSVNELNDARRMAGWIALRLLNEPKVALGHFSAMAKSADGPITSSTAHYWLGRTYRILGDGEKAQAHFREASAYFDTFYGQLAQQTLAPKSAALRVPMPREPTPEHASRFAARDGVKAVNAARQAGLKTFARLGLGHLRYHLLDSPEETALVAHLSEALGDTQFSLRTGKAALTRGYGLGIYAFPTHAFPHYEPLRPPPETAFLMGIARQESEFNSLTQSGAGARGVLQVMPITARHVCRDYKLSCQIPRLMSEPAYNATIASAYIGDRMEEFGGSYVMTLAGYNAGPGRVRQWVREFGDPRTPQVDPVDWIERIPFEETRNYVKKVLANIQVYRARLGKDESALQIIADLYRASTGAPSAPNGTIPARTRASAN